mmetsp:Transcript_76137/g.88519  ORF Transcript_76137/g.88519 Transcript_76137/m.88519 type:complete len:149 (-) Transcript_76137:164-610(-)
MVNSFKYTQQNGIELGSDYPYLAKNGTCMYNLSKIVFKNTGYQSVGKNNATLLKAAVAQQPVSVAIQANQQVFQFYKSGIITTNCTTSLNHAVLVVGYGTANATDYWIVKNSWGSNWGLKGYVYIASGSQNSGAGVCGINMMPSYPTL